MTEHGRTFLSSMTFACPSRLAMCGAYLFWFQLVLENSLKKVLDTKFLDNVTDTLRVFSSDLITWKTLAIIKTDRARDIKPEWLQITTASLSKWDKRDLGEPFRPDSRRGHARVKPESMTSAGTTNQHVLELDFSWNPEPACVGIGQVSHAETGVLQPSREC